MAIADFGTVICFVDADGVGVHFGRGDSITKAAVKSMRGRWNPARTQWRVACDSARKTPDQIVAVIADALQAAAPEFWIKSLPRLAVNACVSRAYSLKVGIGGLRIELPPGHVLDWTLEHKIQGAVRDGSAWLISPAAAHTKEVREGVERVMREDHKIFSEAAQFIGPRRIGGSLHMDGREAARIGITIGAKLAADKSFFDVADPDMQVADLYEWCLTVEDLMPQGESGYSAILRYTDSAIAFPFLRARRAVEAPSPALGSGHVRVKWDRQEKVK